MTLNLNSVLLGSADPQGLAEFYGKVLGDPSWKGEEGDWVGWQVGDGWLGIGPHDQVHGKNGQPGRIMMGFEIADVEGEFERLSELGTKVIAEPYHPGEAGDMTVATFEDPDGNYFQIASPMKET